MALLWQEKRQGNHYKVTRAGQSLRLYRNGVFHTQYHPERIITGDIWELMLLASLHIPDQARVLLLGAGGGAMLNLLNHFLSPAVIDVVDMDATVLELCQRFFLKRADNVVFHEADAKQWLEKRSASPKTWRYDLIVEDLFGEENGQPLKAFAFTDTWLTLLNKQLKDSGSLVVNFESSRQLRESSAIQEPACLQKLGFKTTIRFSSPRYQNNIALFAKTVLSSSEIRQTISHDPLLRKQKENYYIRQL